MSRKTHVFKLPKTVLLLLLQLEQFRYDCDGADFLRAIIYFYYVIWMLLAACISESHIMTNHDHRTDCFLSKAEAL